MTVTQEQHISLINGVVSILIKHNTSSSLSLNSYFNPFASSVKAAAYPVPISVFFRYIVNAQYGKWVGKVKLSKKQFSEHIMRLSDVFFCSLFCSSSFVMVVANYNIFDSSLPPAFCIFNKKAGVWTSSRLKWLLKHLHTLHLSLPHRHIWIHIQYLWF